MSKFRGAWLGISLSAAFSQAWGAPVSLTSEIQSKLKKTCLSLDADVARKCVFLVAATVNDPEICNVLENSDAARTCSEMAAGHEEICNTLPSGARAECSRTVFRGYLAKMAEVRGLDIRSRDMRAFCRNYPKGHVLSSECKSFLDADGARAKLNFEICDRVGELHGREECIERVLPRALRAGGDESLCRGLKNPGDRMYCAAVLHGHFGGQALQGCLEGQGDVRIACEDRVRARFAKNRKAAALCEEIQTPWRKTECLVSTFVTEAVHQINEFNAKSAVKLIEEVSKVPRPQLAKEDAPQLKSEPLVMDVEFKEADLSVRGFKDHPRRARSKTLFTRHEGPEFGLDLPRMRGSDLWDITNLGRGVAAGDIDGDGWQDLVFATRDGPLIYRNLGGMKFVKQKISPDLELVDRELLGVALVDINGDGALDMLCATYSGEVYFLLNHGGKFSAKDMVRVPNKNRRNLVRAIGFAQLEKNQGLDFYLGNWTIQQSTAEHSESEIYRNRDLRFELQPLVDRARGQSFSVLFSRLKPQRSPYMLIASNMGKADDVFSFSPMGVARAAKEKGELFAEAHRGTISYDSGDVNGDLKIDVFTSTHIFVQNYTGSLCAQIKNSAEKESCERNERIAQAILGGNVEACRAYAPGDDQADCASYVLTINAGRTGQVDLCDKIPERFSFLRKRCKGEHHTLESDVVSDKVSKRSAERSPHNHLFIQGAGKGFDDRAKEWNVENAGWTWNAKLADLDNDGWLDLYVATGASLMNQVSTNFLFLNDRGQHFKEQTAASGVQENFASSSFAYVDLTNSGVMDIVSNASNGPLRIYLNHTQSNSIVFELRDKGLNTRAIGAQLIVTDSKGRKQIREIKASGGYLSFDPQLAHFGLASADQVDALEIIWPDARSTKIKHAFPANHHYIIQRN